MTTKSIKIYKKIFNLCDKKGLITKLVKSLGANEETDYKKLNITKSGLRILDSVHCIFDKERTEIFLDEIEKVIKRKKIKNVIEAGVGTGTLSFMAALCGARVFGVEINKDIFELAENFRNALVRNKTIPNDSVSFVKADATKIKNIEMVDLIISENLYTGMFFEKQTKILNHLLPYLKKGGTVLPSGMDSFLILNQTTFKNKPKNLDLFVPSEERGIEYWSKPLSNAIPYDRVNFYKKTKSGFSKTVIVKIINNGTINSLRIYSEVLMPSGLRIGRFDTTFLNSDIIIALKKTLEVGRGDRVLIKISYKYGDSPKNANVEIKKVISH